MHGAHDLFGFDELRPGQEALQGVFAARETVPLFPTGSGKSAIYELAMALGGAGTIVMSPLLSLKSH